MWQATVAVTLAFWLSASLVLDLIVMPILYTAGMMTEPGFAAAGYSLFWVFNRVELLCAALVLTGSLVAFYRPRSREYNSQKNAFLAGLLLIVALVFTYGLTPEMSALGIRLSLFDSGTEAPVLMNSLHIGYWLLEMVKLFVTGWLLQGYLRGFQGFSAEAS